MSKEIILNRFTQIKDPLQGIEDGLEKGIKFRKMVQYIEYRWPELCDDILKNIGLTRFEIRTLSYTTRQFNRLQQFCEKHHYKH